MGVAVAGVVVGRAFANALRSTGASEAGYLAWSPSFSERRHPCTTGIRLVGRQRWTDPHIEGDVNGGDDCHRDAVVHRRLVEPLFDGIERSLHEKWMTANQFQTSTVPVSSIRAANLTVP